MPRRTVCPNDHRDRSCSCGTEAASSLELESSEGETSEVPLPLVANVEAEEQAWCLLLLPPCTLLAPSGTPAVPIAPTTALHVCSRPGALEMPSTNRVGSAKGEAETLGDLMGLVQAGIDAVGL